MSKEIYIYSGIGEGGITAEGIAASLAMANGEDVSLRINSPGGSVFEGVAICNLLRKHAGKVTAYVDGIAASIASVIAMGAKEVVMGTGSMLFLHSPLVSYAGGNADALRKTAEDLDAVEKSIMEIYASRTGMSADDIKKLMENESYIGAEDAVRLKFADRIAPLDESAFSNNANMSLVSSFRNAVPVASIFEAAGFEFTAESAKAVVEAAKAGKPAVEAASLSKAFEACGIALADVVADEHCIAKAIAAAREDGAAKAEAELSRLNTEFDNLTKAHASVAESMKAHASIAAKLGLQAGASADDIAKAFEAKASADAAALLASQGVPAPIPDDPTASSIILAKSDKDMFAEYSAMESGKARDDFFAKHKAAIWRGSRSA